jgi:hypothetical protein
MSDAESGWLIEFPGAFPAWWDGRDLDTGVTDANDAVRLEGHHYRGYTEPLVVRWLCTKCHRAVHREGVAV